jgi:hypothetical protein
MKKKESTNYLPALQEIEVLEPGAAVFDGHQGKGADLLL